jgi:K+-transporting ATPase ATPase A chain
MMIDLAQAGLYAALLFAIAIPLGAYIARVFTGEAVFLAPVERVILGVAGGGAPQRWGTYAVALLTFNAAGFFLLFGILLFQDALPLNPQGFGGLSWHLAFNTAVSFVTNTNWQSYGGETTLSHFSQMVGLTTQNFLSAATGMAVAAAVARGLAAKPVAGGVRVVGNFWRDLTRITLYILIPGAFVIALALLALGVPQTLQGSVTAQTLEGAQQTLSVGPVASQLAIKQLGTNGGGFFNVNSAHPFENPDALSNLIQMLAILAIPAALVLAYGRLVGDRRQGRALFAAMAILLVAAFTATYAAERAGNPLTAAFTDPASGNMEGKEVRFGIVNSVLWAVTMLISTQK